MEFWMRAAGVTIWRYGALEAPLQACRHGGIGWRDGERENAGNEDVNKGR
jgi:hypothetical protein